MTAIKSMDRLLVIGSGGYISSVVLPVLKTHFPSVSITVASRRSARCVTMAEQNGLNVLGSLAEIKAFTHVLIADSPLETGDLISLTGPAASIWIEKPIVECRISELDRLNEILRGRQHLTYVGMNKRQCLKPYLAQFSPATSVDAIVEFPIQFNPEMRQSLWKEFLIRGGVYWTDGIHALDIATQLISENPKIDVQKFEESIWQFRVSNLTGECLVRIGADVSKPRIVINGDDIGDFISNEKSRLYFQASFSEFISGKSNFENVQSSHKIWINLLDDLLPR